MITPLGGRSGQHWAGAGQLRLTSMTVLEGNDNMIQQNDVDSSKAW